MSGMLRIFKIIHSMKTAHISLGAFSAAALIALCSLAFVAHAQETGTTPTENYQLLQDRASEILPEEDVTDESYTEDLQTEDPILDLEDGESLPEGSTDVVIEDGFEGVQPVLTKEKQSRIRNLSANTSNRMEAAIARIMQIIERTEARINLLEMENIDTSEARTQLEEARTHIENATLTIVGIDVLIDGVAYSEAPKEAWEQTKTVYIGTATDIRNAHSALKNSVATLTQAVAAAQTNNTTTEATLETQ